MQTNPPNTQTQSTISRRLCFKSTLILEDLLRSSNLEISVSLSRFFFHCLYIRDLWKWWSLRCAALCNQQIEERGEIFSTAIYEWVCRKIKSRPLCNYRVASDFLRSFMPLRHATSLKDNFAQFWFSLFYENC